MNHSAAGMVRKFISNFRTPFPHNQEYFQILARTVVPEQMKYGHAERIIYFGKYLQSNDLPNPLTWSEIDDVLAHLPPDKIAAKSVRSCLLSLGHMLANEGRIESRKDYQLRREMTEQIEKAPLAIKSVVNSFAEWSLDRNTFQYVTAQVESVCSLWKWSEERGVNSIFSLTGGQINRYFLETYWDLRCRCGVALPRSQHENATKACTSCGFKGPFKNVAKRNPSTISLALGRIVRFFEWARQNHFVVDNPVTIPPGSRKRQIQHCSVDVLFAILEYIKNPNNDPTDALILYLVIIHLFSGGELQKVRFPKDDTGSGEADLATTYAVVAPDRPTSPGRHRKARPIQQIGFLEDAREWFGPLLSRFQCERSKALHGRANDFLFVAPGRTINNVPVSIVFLSERVRRITKQIVGFEIGLNLLKKTAAVFIADVEGPQFLEQLGFGGTQAMSYCWEDRELIA